MKYTNRLALAFFAFLMTVTCMGLQAQNSVVPKKEIKPTERLSGVPEPLRKLPTVNGQLNQSTEPFRYPTSDLSSIKALELLKELRLNNPDLVVHYSENGTINFLSGKLLMKTVKDFIPDTLLSDNHQTALKFLRDYAPLLKINNPLTELKYRLSEKDHKGNEHFRFDQYWNGVKVWGADLVIHLNKEGVYGLNGRYIPSPSHLKTDSKADAGAVIQQCVNDLAKKAKFVPLTEQHQQLLDYSVPQAETIIWEDVKTGGGLRLTYHITIRPNLVQRWEYFVDAQTGTILFDFNHTCHVDGPKTAETLDLMGQTVTIHYYELDGKFYMIDASRPMYNAGASRLPNDPIGAIVTYDAQGSMAENLELVTSPDGNWTDANAVSAHHNAALCYEYYKDIHNRNSINGTGGTVISVINVGESFENAFWNGKLMAYGNGGFCFQPLAKGLDVAGHEMTHGVISNSAGLIYEFQSGALNESYADIFACCIDNDDWKIGEDISNTVCFPSGALRDLEDPNQGTTVNGYGWQPKKMSEFQIMDISQDQGGVHVNSGIPNHAFYLFSMAITRDTAEKIFYHALTKYLTASSKFIDQRRAVIQSCKDLYPDADEYVKQAGIAFDIVEIFDDGSPGSQPPKDLPPVEGIGYLLIHSPENQNGIHLLNERTKAVQKISDRQAESRCSVDDEGAVAFFISKDDKNLYSIALDGESFGERRWTSDNYWKNVAVSRDGKRLACVSRYADSSIYVFNLATPQVEMKRFILYHPTFTQGVTGGNPRFADAVEFDATGEYVVYDARTETETGNGESISYWDIGFMRVWDYSKNNFGDGKIQKLFSNLPAKVSITNPTYSKNSPYVIAFDYVKEDVDDYIVTGFNTERSTSGEISLQNQLGYPTFSTYDDQLAFSNAVGVNPAIQVVNLQKDKITRNGLPSVLVRNYRWPVWFTQGERPTEEENPNNRPETPEISFRIYPNPTDNQFTIMCENGSLEKWEIFDLTGRMILSKTINPENQAEQQHQVSTEALNAGVYFCKVFGTRGNVVTQKVMISR